jgi:hypothetical protein
MDRSIHVWCWSASTTKVGCDKVSSRVMLMSFTICNMTEILDLMIHVPTLGASSRLYYSFWFGILHACICTCFTISEFHCSTYHSNFLTSWLCTNQSLPDHTHCHHFTSWIYHVWPRCFTIWCCEKMSPKIVVVLFRVSCDIILCSAAPLFL